jgi:hypothetical protein
MDQQSRSNEYILERMIKALEMARSALSQVNLSSSGQSRKADQPNPDALPIAILAAARFAHVEPDSRPR